MVVLSRDNITEYLKSRMPEMDFSKPLEIIPIGEGSLEEDAPRKSKPRSRESVMTNCRINASKAV